MRRTTPLLSTLLCACLTACAGDSSEITATRAPATDPASGAPATDACTDGPLLRPGDVAAVEPLWAPSPLVKSPSYQLAGVLVELQPAAGRTREDLQAALRCPTACLTGTPDPLALPGLHASIDASPGHLTMVLRSDDPGTVREAMHRAERLRSKR